MIPKLSSDEIKKMVDEKEEKLKKKKEKYEEWEQRAHMLAFISDKLIPPARKYLKNFCPICSSKLEHKKYWQYEAPTIHYYSCPCGYEYAKYVKTLKEQM